MANLFPKFHGALLSLTLSNSIVKFFIHLNKYKNIEAAKKKEAGRDEKLLIYLMWPKRCGLDAASCHCLILNLILRNLSIRKSVDHITRLASQ